MRTINVTAGEAEDLTAIIEATQDGDDLTGVTVQLALGDSTTIAPVGGWQAPDDLQVTADVVRASLLVDDVGQAGTQRKLWAKVAKDGRTYLLCCANEYVTIL